MFDAVAAEATGGTRTITVAGATVRLVAQPPAGALLVFVRRLQSKDPMEQIAAIVRLFESWVEPDDHDQLYTAIERIVDIGEFMEIELPKLVETATARPTSAPASLPAS